MYKQSGRQLIQGPVVAFLVLSSYVVSNNRCKLSGSVLPFLALLFHVFTPQCITMQFTHSKIA